MIITDQEILRAHNEDVKPEEVSDLVALLERELAASPNGGLGLAAPQIGINKRIAIIRINSDLKLDLVNCRIEKQYDPLVFKGEGCLSMPDKKVDTIRYQEICVAGNLVEPHSFIATDLASIVIQHELDHLNGILMIDRQVNKPSKKVKPNDPCSCGSGRKAKKCCHGMANQRS
jgi:peptide deformylase